MQIGLKQHANFVIFGGKIKQIWHARLHSLSHSCLGLHKTGLVTSGAINCSRVTQVVPVVVCPVWFGDSHDPAVCGASGHLPWLLPLLLDKPTHTPRGRVARRPSTALFFCDGDATTAAVTCYRGARPSSYIFGYIKTRKFTYNILKITCKNCMSFSPECVGPNVSAHLTGHPEGKAYTNCG